jgi:hypothetical protein
LAEAIRTPVETLDACQSGTRISPFRCPAKPLFFFGKAPVDETRKPGKKIPPAVFSDDPEVELEEELREHPNDASAKVDVGSDESMDASDPVSVARPGSGEPVPSSDSPEEREDSQDCD